MKLTKFIHSCLLVEMPEPVNRTVLFDPGSLSESALKVESLQYLDDIVITHIHGDHFSMNLLKQLVQKFPQVRITTTPEVVSQLSAEGITASAAPLEGISLFESSHEHVEPLFPLPQNIGVHYLDKLTNPGDSHNFTETKTVLALPITAPWGATIKAINLAIGLKPKYVVPIHDWHWSDDARNMMYDLIEKPLAANGITFLKLQTGEPVTIEV